MKANLYNFSKFLAAIVLAANSLTRAELKVRTNDDTGTVIVSENGVPIATYSYRDERVRRPYFAHVKAPNGIQVTRNWPPIEGVDPTDHDTIHPGIWMAFGNINGGDFWRNKGLIRHNRFIETPHSIGGGLRFVVENEYIDNGVTYCVETAEHQILPRDNGYLFLFDSRFRAVGGTLNFGDQQEMGLGIRFATPLMVKGGTGKIVNSQGQVNETEAWGQQALWTDYAGIIEGKRTGAMLMPDPRNFRISRFHSRDYGFTAANPFADKDFVGGKARHTLVGRGKRLHLQFGLLVYSLKDEKELDRDSVYQRFLDTIEVPGQPKGNPWQLHTIDASSRGADGTRAGDINGDGLIDFTTGWEEGGQVRVTINPGPEKVKTPWPSVVVGQVPAPEDAVFADLNNDGILDVVSSTEGATRTLFAHFAPRAVEDLTRPEMWQTQPFTQSEGITQWMFAMPLQVDGLGGSDLVAGSKEAGGAIGWLRSPKNPSDASAWSWSSFAPAGWIMSIRESDMDGDGDPDILYSDRTKAEAGIWWLENPGDGSAHWQRHFVAGADREVMFLDTGDWDGDGFEDVIAAARDDDFIVALRRSTGFPTWEETTIPYPTGTGTGKAVAIGDIDGDETPDLVVTCENAFDASGVYWMEWQDGPEPHWAINDISGYETGVKFDRIELIDLDADGDLDVVTCEENHNLGVIWYENPF